VSDNPLATIRQGLFGILRDEGVGLGPQRGSQHSARPVARDLGQRIIHRFRLTKGDDVCSLLHGVSFLWEVLAGFDTRHDTPPFQTPSPISRHSSQVPRSGSTVRRDYKTLSDSTFPVSDLSRLPDEYNKWIDGLSARIDPSRGVTDANEALIEQQNFEEDCEAYRVESHDIARGVDLLTRAQVAFNADPNAPAGAPFRAWIMMNATFKDAGGDKFVEWRLFQLAFILAQIAGFASRLPSYADDFDVERDEETASLLYFATGGGKSEAFFGTLVYLLFLDRLRG